MRTREEWLHAILYSGQVTRIGQHLALVIYHLTDPATNTVKLSARDLARITGWGRTAILDHLTELDIFIRVTWGAGGRAKALFELQGVIAQALEERRQADATPATNPFVREEDATAATTAAITPCVRGEATTAAIKEAAPTTQAATTPCVREAATTAATSGYGQPDGHNSVREAATSAQKTNEGGTIGGEYVVTVQNQNNTHTLFRSQAPDWTISEDGGFEGRVFELSGLDYLALQVAYNHLEWPADLVAADQFFAREFDRAGVSPPMPQRNAGLHTYLAKQNRKVVEMRRMYEAMATAKGEKVRKPAKPIVEPEAPPSAWFDNEARLHIANGFRAELLEICGGDEARLREELNVAAGYVGVNVKGPQLIAKIRSRITDQLAKAKGRGAYRNGAGAAEGGETRRELMRRIANEEEAKIIAERQRRRTQ